MAYERFEGRRVFVHEQGTGAPVVFLHAAASSHVQWRWLFRHLEGDYTLIAPDLPGNGESEALPGYPSIIDDDVRFVRWVAERAGRRVHVVGHSYGGVVAMHLAATAPDCVRSLTLVEPVLLHLVGDLPKEPGMEELRAAKAACRTALATGDARLAAFHFIAYFGGTAQWDGLPEAAKEALAQGMPRLLRGWGELFIPRFALDKLANSGIPALVVSGETSPEPLRKVARTIAEGLGRARHVVVQQAGHMLPLTHAAPLARAVESHLGGGTGTHKRVFVPGPALAPKGINEPIHGRAAS